MWAAAGTPTVARWLADPAATLRAYPDLQSWPATYNIVMPNQNLSTQESTPLRALSRGLESRWVPPQRGWLVALPSW